MGVLLFALYVLVGAFIGIQFCKLDQTTVENFDANDWKGVVLCMFIWPMFLAFWILEVIPKLKISKILVSDISLKRNKRKRYDNETSEI